MDMKLTKLKHYTRSLNSGFTMIELLISAVIAGVILSVSLGLINEQRRLVLGDQTQGQANQNLRAAMDLVGNDIKLAGAYLDSVTTLPVVSVVDGNGINDDPNEHDRLVLQRKIIPDTLTVCEDVSTSDTTIVVARKNDLTAENCNFTDLDNGNRSGQVSDALTDSINAFRDHRCSFAGTSACNRTRTVVATEIADCDEECVVAMIVDPTTGNNELFYYVYEECTDSVLGANCTAQIAGGTSVGLLRNIIHAIPLEGNDWQNTYTAGSLIYIFEEREYRFDDDEGTLELVTDRQDRWPDSSEAENNGEPLPLVNHIRDFRVEVGIKPTISTLQDSINDAPNSASPFYSDWQTIGRVRIHLEASNSSNSDQITLPLGGCSSAPSEHRLCLASDFFPRNSLSRQ